MLSERSLAVLRGRLSGPKVAYNRHCVGAGADDSVSIACVDATDSHYCDSWHRSPNGGQSYQTHHRICAVFSGRLKDWTDSQVVDGQVRRLLGLSQVVSGEANDYVVAKQASCGFNGKIVLSQVYTISLERKRDVDAVIYYDLNAAMTRD
jgi:hypothetical protein